MMEGFIGFDMTKELLLTIGRIKKIRNVYCQTSLKLRKDENKDQFVENNT